MQISSSRKPVRSYTLLGYYVRLVWPKITFLIYLSTVRPVLEYAVSVWQAIPEVLFIRCSLGSSKNGFEEGNS